MDIETIIIGGGQAGLSASYYLSQRGSEHVVLERADEAGFAWRDDRWDSFTLNTPNWSFRLPGAEYQGSQPDAFMHRIEILQRFEDYIQRYTLPVQFGIDVQSVEAADSGYRVQTSNGDFSAKNVIVATGLYQKPKLPAFSAEIDPEILQIHTGQYRNPQALPPGAVLVVGSAQSGCQVAEELYQAGRKVYLSTCSVGRVPRRYRGKDIIEWLHRVGFFDRTPEKLPSPQARFAGNPQISGTNGGHTINLNRFYLDGVILLGRIQALVDGKLIFAPDLKENLAKTDAFEANALKIIDDYIARERLDTPDRDNVSLNAAYAAPEILSLNLRQAGIGTIIWAIGYAFDFSMVKLPVVDTFGFPITESGVTRYQGLFFAGMPWLPGQKSGLLLGVGEQAAHVTEKII